MKIISQNKRTAIKEHRCDYCAGVINKGDIYQSSFIRFDGVYQWKNHIDCQRIADKLRLFDDCDEGLSEDDFKESIKDRYDYLLEVHGFHETETDYIKRSSFQDQLKFVIENDLSNSEVNSTPSQNETI
jgi:hypothetical protein